MVRSHHEREVSELRRRKPQCLVEQDLPGRVRDVVLAADHMRDLHQRVVDDDSEVVLRPPVGPDDDRIAELLRVERDIAAHDVVECDLRAVGDLEPNHGALARFHAPARLLGRQRPAGAAIARRPCRREIRLALGVELLRGTEAEVRVPAGHELVGVRRIEVEPLGLAIRPVQAADVRPLVPVQAEPSKILEDAVLRLARGAFGVGVLDAEDEGAVLPVRKQPVEQRRAGVAHVQLAGGAGCETNSHQSLIPDPESGIIDRRSATACAAMASPRPIASTPSLVFPFTLTRAASIPSASATRAWISATYGAIFGRSRTTLTSTFSTTNPAART